MAEAQWFVAHTYSGYENKVKVDIEKTIENRGLQDQILEVTVPMETILEVKNGVEKSFLPAPYNWRSYGEMNVAFWQKHQQTPLEKAIKLLHQSQEKVLTLAETFTNEELFSKSVYKWVGGSTLGSYFVSCTSSHYDWAMKKLKAHQKNCKNQ